jgi:hypothetical protein
MKNHTMRFSLSHVPLLDLSPLPEQEQMRLRDAAARRLLKRARFWCAAAFALLAVLAGAALPVVAVGLAGDDAFRVIRWAILPSILGFSWVGYRLYANACRRLVNEELSRTRRERTG